MPKGRPKNKKTKDREKEYQPWNHSPPSMKKCCICGHDFSEEMPLHKIPKRPTGVFFKKQAWPFCKPCWESHSSLHRDMDYARFLQEIIRKPQGVLLDVEG